MRALWLILLLTPVLLASAKESQITIEDTGSTNRLGVRLTFDQHGEATVQAHRGEPQQVKLDQSQCKQFLHNLKAVGSLSALPVVHCAKSVSFGSSLFVELDSDRSPDLNCPSEDPPLESLKKQAYELLGAAREKAGIPSRRTLSLQRPVAPK
ncbi:MAG TPA: hypothetical protein VH351_23010 [Bryobacteraceae bacterium]|nr:hypothetical protein [Bryobacteraceae bacterium]